MIPAECYTYLRHVVMTALLTNSMVHVRIRRNTLGRNVPLTCSSLVMSRVGGVLKGASTRLLNGSVSANLIAYLKPSERISRSMLSLKYFGSIFGLTFGSEDTECCKNMVIKVAVHHSIITHDRATRPRMSQAGVNSDVSALGEGQRLW